MLLNRTQLLTIFAGGTLLGGGGALVTRLVATQQLALPEDAEWVEASDGIISDTPQNGEDVSVSKRMQRAKKGTFIDSIIRRNMFDSTKVGQVASGDGSGDSGTRTSLPLVLLATMVANPATSSSALMTEEKSDDGAQGYGIGDSVLGEATVFRIEQKRVVLQRPDGALEYLEMDGEPMARTTSTKSTKSKSGVEKQDGNKYTVDEDTFNKAMENPEKLAQQIRAVPHTDASGQIDGYRLSGIRRSSLFNKLGIRNGDIVHTVNGNDLTSMNSAMEAYNSLQNERNFNFEITRRNKKQTFEYEVR